jgi:hypothetical protein
LLVLIEKLLAGALVFLGAGALLFAALVDQLLAERTEHLVDFLLAHAAFFAALLIAQAGGELLRINVHVLLFELPADVVADGVADLFL